MHLCHQRALRHCAARLPTQLPLLPHAQEWLGDTELANDGGWVPFTLEVVQKRIDREGQDHFGLWKIVKYRSDGRHRHIRITKLVQNEDRTPLPLSTPNVCDH